jgi:hypothetical protein
MLVLLAAQSTPSQNGPWVAQSGAWARPSWYPSGGTTQAFQFITIFVRQGVVYQGTTWDQTAAGIITIDTTPTTWLIVPFALSGSTLTGIIPNANTTATNLNAPSTIVERDASGNFSAGTITANLTGNASGSAGSFTGSLSGDVTGTQSATVVSFVGGESSSAVAASVLATQAATNLNAPSTIVKRDASGNFSAGTITANLTGNATNITATANSTLTTLSALTTASALAITGSQVGGFTQGSVIFAGASGQLTQDNANFYWNDTTQNLGIATIPSISVMIDGVNSTLASKLVQMTGYGVGSSTGYRGRFARGTLGTPAAVQAGDNLNTISGRGYGTSQFALASTGVMNIVAGETFTNASNATYIAFSVTPTGSVTTAEAMRINSTGNVLIGTTTDSGTQKLQVNGNSGVGTVTTGTWNGTVTAGVSFLTTGTTYTTPANITTNTLFKFTLVGGGAGGSSPNAAADHGSAGGAGGGLILYISGLSPSTAYTISIGAAGTGGASGAVGNPGGNTTLIIGATTYTASGGSAAATTTGSGGVGGAATNGTINIAGQNGGGGSTVATATGGQGGDAAFGLGLGGASIGAGITGNGISGTGFGAGGGGSAGSGGPTGGNGTQGCILVEWQN